MFGKELIHEIANLNMIYIHFGENPIRNDKQNYEHILMYIYYFTLDKVFNRKLNIINMIITSYSLYGVNCLLH